MKQIGENNEEILEQGRKTIVHLLGLALKKEISWKFLVPLINEMASTLEKSKEVIKILLNELESLSTQNLSVESDISMIETLQGNSIVSKTEFEYINVEIEPENDPEREGTIFEHSNHDSVKDDIISNCAKEAANMNDIIDQDLKVFVESDTEIQNKGENHTVDNENQLIELNEKKVQRIDKQAEKSHVTIHTGEVKPFECKNCNKRFKHRSALSRHKIIHTGKAPHECATCKKRFNQKVNLKSHELVHTDMMPYECKYCKKRFKERGNLSRHERIHTGEVPYECETCNKRFKLFSHLRSHERIHTGEKPYECSTCKKTFSQLNNLKRHKRIHIGQMQEKIQASK